MSVAAAVDGSRVGQATWDEWERSRLEANRRSEIRCRWERARPVAPTVADYEAQLHALRWHNEALVAEVERLRGLERALAALVSRA